ncbi:MAG: hypothetical protein ACHQQS_16875, partial [Thermoanaerobaculales bacterium]
MKPPANFWSPVSASSRSTFEDTRGHARRGACSLAVVVLALASVGTLRAQQVPEPKEIEELKAQFVALLNHQEAQHRVEIEALTKTIASLSARVQQLESERGAFPQPPSVSAAP